MTARRVLFEEDRVTHRINRFVLVFCLIVAASVQTHAVCVAPSIDGLLKTEAIALVFRGNVVAIQQIQNGEIVTFKVTTVWKGSASKRLVLYNALLGREDDRPFTSGEDYLVVATVQGDDEREAMALPADGSKRFSADCLSLPFRSPQVQQIVGGKPAPPALSRHYRGPRRLISLNTDQRRRLRPAE